MKMKNQYRQAEFDFDDGLPPKALLRGRIRAYVEELNMLDVSTWPTVDIHSLSDKNAETFMKRKVAIEMWINSSTLDQVENNTGIRRAELYKFIEKCLVMHADGRIKGFRGIIPFVRSAENKRKKPLTIKRGNHQGGAAGEFGRLIDKYPQLRELIYTKLFPKSSKKYIYERKISKKNLHSLFIEKCREIGLDKEFEYPFNVDLLGYVSFVNYVNKLISNNPELNASNRLNSDVMKRMKTGDGTKRPSLELMGRVECDAHHLDALFCILIPTPFGTVIPKIVNRLWIIVLIECKSRAVLGYHLSLRKECNEEDLLSAIMNSLKRREKRELKIPGLEYKYGAGFPSSYNSNYCGACWDELSVDRAKINTSARVEKVLKTVVGSKVEVIKRVIPNDRPFIERFFKTLEEGSFHRLPSSVGSSPADIKGWYPDLAAVKYFIQVEHLYDLLDVVIANYNATVHSSLAGRTPNESFDYFAKALPHPLRKISEEEADMVMCVRRQVIVRGSLEGGRRPYVQYCGVKYSSDYFRNCFKLIGKKIIIEANSQDARVIRAFGVNGEDLGPLRAAPPWHEIPHSFLIRSGVFKAIRQGDIIPTNAHPIISYLDYLENIARTKKDVPVSYLELRKYLVDAEEEVKDVFSVKEGNSAGNNDDMKIGLIKIEARKPRSKSSNSSNKSIDAPSDNGGIPAPKKARVLE